jgi:hypothetical protein
MLRDVTDGHRTIRKWLTARRLRRRFRKTSPFALDALPEDTFGRVSGAAQPFEGKQLVAPISLRPCVYWMVEIVEDVGEDWPSSLILVQEDGVPFVLHHEGHRAVVDPKDATVSLAFDHAADPQGIDRANKEQRGLLARYLPHRDFTHTHVLRIREAVIEIGEAVTVLGSGTREPDPEAAPSAYRDAGHTRLRLTSSKKYPLCITDNPKIL